VGSLVVECSAVLSLLFLSIVSCMLSCNALLGRLVMRVLSRLITSCEKIPDEIAYTAPWPCVCMLRSIVNTIGLGYIWPSLCHCHSLSLASVESRLVLPFWYRLTQVVLDKGSLNGSARVCVLNRRENA